MNLTVTVNKRTNQGTSGFEGSVQLPGLKATKLARKDGSTLFPNLSALKSTARTAGKKLNLVVEYKEPKAAKKTTKPVKSPKAKRTTPAPQSVPSAS